eukprot:5149856-Pyramimonas_sp.AAC.1
MVQNGPRTYSTLGCHAVPMILAMEGVDNLFMDAHIYLETTESSQDNEQGNLRADNFRPVFIRDFI